MEAIPDKKYPVIECILTLAFMIILCEPLSAQGSYEYPLQCSGHNHYLTDHNGKPFFWSGEAAWSLIALLNNKDAGLYLDDCERKGFTVLLVNLIEHKFSDHAPSDFYGDAPFTGKPFVSSNEAYFKHVEDVIRAAGKRGIAVLLCPLYLGYNYGDEGWGAEVKNATPDDLNRWGRYVGTRYKNIKNIIWCIGGDADPSLEKEKVLAFVNGLLATDKNHLITAHNAPEQMAIAPWQGERWLNINNVYTYSRTLYEICKQANENVPFLPWFLAESAYENEHNSTPRQLRSEAYWPLLCGSMGYIFGNCPIWNFSSATGFCKKADWKSQLNTEGSRSMMHLQKLFRSRPWHLLSPDFSHLAIKKGYGEWGGENYVLDAVAKDSSFMIAYLPVKTELTINLAVISGKRARCWWYNPSTGKNFVIGIFPTQSNTHEFTPPSDGDWILVVDDDSRNYGPPATKESY